MLGFILYMIFKISISVSSTLDPTQKCSVTELAKYTVKF